GGVVPAAAVVLHNLAASNQEEPRVPRLEPSSSTRIDLVFFAQVDALVVQGVLEQAVAMRRQVVSVHVTEHRVFRFAVVLRPVDLAPATLRLLNEHRYGRLLLEARGAELVRLRGKLARRD